MCEAVVGVVQAIPRLLPPGKGFEINQNNFRNVCCHRAKVT